jgi:hypothetical protein
MQSNGFRQTSEGARGDRGRCASQSLRIWPNVSLDNELLVVLSAGAPNRAGYLLGLGEARLASQDQGREIPLSVAAGGALVDALLGFNATAGLLALLTTIVGATNGANL